LKSWEQAVAKCKSLLKNVEKAVAESGISADVIKVDSNPGDHGKRGDDDPCTVHRWKVGDGRQNGNS